MPFFGGGPDIPISSDPLDTLGEGPLSDSVLHYFDYNYYIKLSLGRYFQVFDENKFWQWEFAENINGCWVSKDIDLRLFNQIYKRINDLRKNRKIPGDIGYDKFYKRVHFDFNHLNHVRNKILKDLWKFHLKKKVSASFTKVVKYQPPILSHFEQFKVENEEIKTIFFLEAVLFRACVKAVQNAEEEYKIAIYHGKLGNSLDIIYQERVTAIIMASSCIETFIKGIISEENNKLFEKIENVPLEVKLELYYNLKNNSNLFDLSIEPLQFFTVLKSKRNRLIHFKKEYIEVQNKGRYTRTYLENDLLKRGFITTIPKKVEEFLYKICIDNNLEIPKWLLNKDHWIHLKP